MDKLSIDKLFFLNSLSTIVYNGLVHKIVDGENKRSAFIELLKSIPVDVNNLADEYGVDAAIKEGLNKNTMAYSSLIYQLSDTDDIDFDKLMAIYRAPANTAENASGAATEAAPEAKWWNKKKSNSILMLFAELFLFHFRMEYHCNIIFNNIQNVHFYLNK